MNLAQFKEHVADGASVIATRFNGCSFNGFSEIRVRNSGGAEQWFPLAGILECARRGVKMSLDSAELTEAQQIAIELGEFVAAKTGWSGNGEWYHIMTHVDRKCIDKIERYRKLTKPAPTLADRARKFAATPFQQWPLVEMEQFFADVIAAENKTD